MSNDLPRIVVVGGGAGGLELVTRLGRKLGRKGKADITLVDDALTHVWKPLLHEAATGAMDQSLDEISYAAHARANGYRYRLGELTAVDRDARTLRLAPIIDDNGEQILVEREVPYDYLVLAIGSVGNDFGTPGVAEHCHFLDNERHAEAFRQALLDAFLRHSDGGPNRDARLSIAIVGGGATGVELAAELLSATDMLAAYVPMETNWKQLDVHVLEGSPGLLPGLPERIRHATTRELERLGVVIHTESMVTQADDQGLLTKSCERIDAELMVWAAGVRGAPVLSRLGLSTLGSNQVKVQQTLASVDDERIFAIGDCAACPLGDDGWVPPRAQSAHQMAATVYHNLRATLENRTLKHFKYRDFGSLVSLSHYTTMGSLAPGSDGHGLFIAGKLAKAFYVSLYRMHQRAVYGVFKTGVKILVDGINSTLRPKLKLH